MYGFHAYKEGEKKKVQYSAHFRDPFYHPKAGFLPAPSCNTSSVYSFVTKGLCSSVNFLSIHFQMTSLTGALLNMHKIESEICVWIDLHKYKNSICTFI